MVKLKPKLGLSLMPTDDFRLATEALFEERRVHVLESNFDAGWYGAPINTWAIELVESFSSTHSLIGHGVTLSALSARMSERQEIWFERTKEEFKLHQYAHASEHFGFSEAGLIAHGAPLALPMDKQSLWQGKEMMKRFADATGGPVGLENLAFAFNLEDVKRQGEFIDNLISVIDGFLLLDLHNIYCQIENFGLSESELLNSYPLQKVREIHLSGGSWSESVSGKRAAVRRDTHDGAVPQEVFNLAALAMKRCPNIKFVILERLGNTMMDWESQCEFRDDFEALEQIMDFCYA